LVKISVWLNNVLESATLEAPLEARYSASSLTKLLDRIRTVVFKARDENTPNYVDLKE